MQHYLPYRVAKIVNPLLVSASKSIRTLFLASGLLLVFSMQAKAQEPEYIQNWLPLEEAEFHFDVFFAVVKCSADSEPMVLLNAFNEAGNVDSIGFTLELTDDAGNEATVEIAKFDIAKATMHIASCDSDEHSNLKFAVPEGLDPATMKIAITYNK